MRASGGAHGGDGERGQMLVTAVLLSFVLLMLVAVATETALIWVQRRNLQNAADAAALAGAQRLPEDPAAAISDAKAWAAKNMSGLTGNEARVFDNNRAIRATVKKRAATVFGDWFGYGGFEITASAAARVAQPLLPGPGVVPLAVDDAAFACAKAGAPQCKTLVLKPWAGENDDPRSSYQLVNIDGQGVSGLEAAIKGGARTPITDPTAQQPGNTGRSLSDGLLTRMEAAAAFGCLTWSQVVLSDGSLDPDCNPLGAAQRGALATYPDVQPTAVIVIPVVTSFCQGGGPACPLDIVGVGTDPRTFAFFWVDWEKTKAVCRPAPGQGGGANPGVGGGRPPGQCQIVGSFILEHPAYLSTHVDDGLADFDDDAVLKVVQLIE